MSTPASTPIPTPRGTSTIRLILAWGFVGIPLLWGVLETLRNALNLFR